MKKDIKKHKKTSPLHLPNRALLRFGAFLVHFFEPRKQEKPPLSAFRRGFCQNNGGEDGFRRPGAGAISMPLRGACNRSAAHGLRPGWLFCRRACARASSARPDNKTTRRECAGLLPVAERTRLYPNYT